MAQNNSKINTTLYKYMLRWEPNAFLALVESARDHYTYFIQMYNTSIQYLIIMKLNSTDKQVANESIIHCRLCLTEMDYSFIN